MPNIDVFDQIVPSEAVTLQLSVAPSLTGTVIDDEFDLKELFLASILDLPFNAYFIQLFEIEVHDTLTATEFVSLQFSAAFPFTTGDLIDDEFDLQELFLASILDLPFNDYFTREPELAITVSDTLVPTEFVNIQLSLTINVSDTLVPTEFVNIELSQFVINVSVSDTLVPTEFVALEFSGLEVNVSDILTPTEFVALQFFPVQEVVEEARGAYLPSRLREIQRLRRLAKLRKILDDEEVLLLME